MTDFEFVKAMEHCANNDCKGCPCKKIGNSCITLSQMLELVKRKMAEIKKLKGGAEK